MKSTFLNSTGSLVRTACALLILGTHNLQAQEVGAYAGLSTATKVRMEAYFKDSNEELANLLGERFRW